MLWAAEKETSGLHQQGVRNTRRLFRTGCRPETGRQTEAGRGSELHNSLRRDGPLRRETEDGDVYKRASSAWPVADVEDDEEPEGHRLHVDGVLQLHS